MSRVVYDGKVKVYYAPAIASVADPTIAEFTTAGTDLTPYITKDGVSVPATQNLVDVGGIDDVYNPEIVGTWGGGPLELTMFRDDADETDAYDLIVYGTKGFIVISRFGTPVAADIVEVWPVEMHEPTLMASAKDEAQKFKAAFAITAEPLMRAVVAAA